MLIGITKHNGLNYYSDSEGMLEEFKMPGGTFINPNIFFTKIYFVNGDSGF